MKVDRRKVQIRCSQAPAIVREVFRGIDGFTSSLEYRNNVNDNKSLTYGEIVPESFIQILDFVGKNSGVALPLKFVDLGCGTGRACITASLSTVLFDRVLGIELVPALVEQAEIAKSALFQLFEDVKSTKNIKDAKNIQKPDRSLNIDLIELKINSLMTSLPHESLKVDYLANLICRDIGHKEFKTLMKHFGGFGKFLSQHSQYFLVDNDNVSLLEIPFELHIQVDSLENRGVDSGKRRLIVTHPEAFFPLPMISYILGDIFEVDWWSEPCVVYAASLLFSDDMMTLLSQRLALLPSTSWFISLKPIVDVEICGLTLKQESFFKMSWQMAKVYIYQKM